MAVLKHRGSTLFLFTPFADREKCKSIKGGSWSTQYKCWLYPISALDEIEAKFLGLKRPDTVEQYYQLKSQAEKRLAKTKVEGGDWEHPFLMRHQKMCVDIARDNKRFGFFLGTGTGKTITSLAINEMRPVKTLVVCPLAIIRTAWMDDANNFFPGMSVVSLNVGKDPGRKKLMRALNTKADIYIANYEQFKILFETLLTMGFGRLIVDESSKMKNPDTGITKDLIKFASTVDEFYPLSGTPAPNTPLEYWAQIEAVRPKLLGPNFYAFRATYFTKLEENEYKWVPIPEKLPRMMEEIKKVAIFLDKEDCLDLPPWTMQMLELDMPSEQMQIYKEMERTQIAELADAVIIAPNKLTSLMKLRQITSGFMLDTEKKAHFVAETKIKALEELLEQIGDKSQVIIWVQFHEEINMIRQMISWKYGPDRVRALFGGTHITESGIEVFDDESVKDAVIREFKEGKAQYLIAHPKTAMYGITFVNAAYAIYFSMSNSYEEFHQSRDRIHRYGQKKNVTYYFLVCKKTIDQAIYKAIHQKKKISEELLNYIRIVKGGGDYDNGKN